MNKQMEFDFFDNDISSSCYGGYNQPGLRVKATTKRFKMEETWERIDNNLNNLVSLIYELTEELRKTRENKKS
jgi:hypothetical protein